MHAKVCYLVVGLFEGFFLSFMSSIKHNYLLRYWLLALIFLIMLYRYINFRKIYKNKDIKKTFGLLHKTKHFLNEKVLYLIFNFYFESNCRNSLLCWWRADKKSLKDVNDFKNIVLRCKHNYSVRKFKTKHFSKCWDTEFIQVRYLYVEV